jgi:pilus assembly protein CpaB
MNTTGDSPGSRLARKTRIRATLFLVLALVAGSAAVFLVKVYLDQARARTATAITDTEPVVVAARDLQIAQVLEPGHLEVVPWPEGRTPAGSYAKVEDLIGHSVESRLVAGEPILASKLADPERGTGLASIITEGMRAMTISVDRVVGVSGFLQPGDYVDVITTMGVDKEIEEALDTEPARVSKIVLQNIRVLAVGEHLSTEGRQAVQVRAVTLEVLPEESERLALASLHGTIQLTMRSRIDQTRIATPGITPLGLLLTEGSALDDLFSESREKLAEAAAAAAEEQRQRQAAAAAAAARRTSARQPTRAQPQPEPAAQQERPPVVEILRGTRGVEQRTLRQPED